MARTDPTIYMRLPPELKARLDAAAMSNRCSLTSEVVRRLESSFASEGVSRHPALGAQTALQLETNDERREQLLAELQAMKSEADSIRSLIDVLEQAAFMVDGDVNSVEAKRREYEVMSLYARLTLQQHKILSIQKEIDQLGR